ncbi:MAG: rhodanese-like domain-containing protein [Planctomycetaceae bacterium]|nr:rhodanese-like domain-containing protein [Planctomycetales bacterium]MCB9927388.1 rhodanese-like domain-containing protein [Planctomycetaceae bacterium]
MTVGTITPKELEALRQKGETIDLIDVRTPVEFREVHAEHARNIPLDVFDPDSVMSNRNGSSDKPLYVICRSGSRAAKACEKLAACGHRNIINVEGGTLAWEQAGLPVKRGKKAMSLERQVRIAAGFLVLLGVVLGFAVHPAFYGLSGFVGAGLMFAGITDTCAMGMLIAKMPWNQVTDCQTK